MLSLVYRPLRPANKNRSCAISFAALGVTLAVFVHLDAPSALGAPSCDIVQTDVRWSALRSEFYHRAQGTKLIPLSWFLALEQKLSSKKFSDTEILNQFGFIPDDTHKQYNPDGLPIGFTRTKIKGEPDYLGFNCAFCHTGQIKYTHPTTYESYCLRIDGAPSLQFNARFVKELLETLKSTLDDESEKRARFVSAVRVKDPFYAMKSGEQLLSEVGMTLAKFGMRARLDPLEWGFGRFDALGNGGNQIFSMMYPDVYDNVRVANGPVSIPSLWGTTSYERMQWNGSVKSFLARGIAEAWTAGALPSQLDLRELQWMEEAVKRLPSPTWPQFFPSIDFVKAKRGESLYHVMKCQECHTASNSRIISVKRIHTDPIAARNFANRKVRTSPDDQNPKPASEIMETLTQHAIDDAVKAKLIPAASGRKTNTWSRETGYVARPLAGIWASPPYLHNGSVPNLYQLFSPRRERSKCFYIDNREYDPVRVGLALKRCDFQSRLDDPTTGFELDTSMPGNYNGGHEYRGNPGEPTEGAGACDDPDPDKRPSGVLGCELSDDERWELIEYLKSLSADQPPQTNIKAMSAAPSPMNKNR